MTRDASGGVLWDFDGVVIDSEELFFRAYSVVLREWGVSVSRRLYGRVWVGGGHGAEWAVENFGLPLAAAELKQRSRPVYQSLLEQHVRLMPGIEAALKRLGARWPMAVATNSPASAVDFVMGKFGLAEHFDDVVTRERYTTPKPAPDAFVAGAAALGLPPERCVVIEDANKGVRAAHAAGCRVIAVPHTFTLENDFSLADCVVGSLDEITPELVAELLRA